VKLINHRIKIERLWELESRYSARPADEDKLIEVRQQIERLVDVRVHAYAKRVRRYPTFR
jgi:hypothetical protein